MLSRNSIFAHRGLWFETKEKNTLQALCRAADAGFSVETDLLQDQAGIRVSHDYENHQPRLDVKSVLGLGRLALNIKSDGAWKVDPASKEKIRASRSFFFDGSPPVMYLVKQAGLRLANRVSDLESPLKLEADVLWVDSFSKDGWWLGHHDVVKLLSSYQTAVFVSPELHGRDPEPMWSQLLELDRQVSSSTEIGVCTDFPSELSIQLGL